jgi:hypothetical protein
MRSTCLRWFLFLIIMSLDIVYGYSQLYINEFCASNNTVLADEKEDYDDWIEIYNATGNPVDIGGMYITDSLDDPVKYRIPSTSPGLTTIPPFGYLILWADHQETQGILHLNFKLGKNGGQIGLADFDGTSYIDSLTYGRQYTNSSSSRYPDGNGPWIYPPPTPGSTNTLPVISGLFINEFCTSNNSILADEFGNYDDWIELYNSTDKPLNIGGLFITDSLNYPVKHRIPTTYPNITTIPAHGYMVLWADNQEEQGLLHLDFSIGRDGEQIGLAGYDGKSYIDSLTYGKQYSNASSSRYPDGNDSWIYPPPTPGSTNTFPNITGLFVNEYCVSNLNITTDENGEYDDWVEIYNSADAPVNIGGLFITDSLGYPAKHRIPSTCPDSTTIPAHGYLVLWTDNQEEQGILHVDFKLGRDGEQIGLAGYDGKNLIDSLTYGEQYSNSSSSRYPDGNNQWLNVPPTPENTNTLPAISGLFINEFCTSNINMITDTQGEYDDWVEIFNSTDVPVDIGGLYITDSLGYPAKHRIPSTCPDSTTIPAHGYLVLWTDNQQGQGILHIEFKLGRDGEQIGLAGYDRKNFIDSLTYGEQYLNSSVSRYPDGINQWLFGPSTPGRKNEQYITEGLYINEFMPNNDNFVADEHGEFNDWIELYNSTDKPLDIGGLFVTDSLGDPAKYRIPTTYPDSTTIPAYGYILLWADKQEEQGILHLGFKLSKTGEAIGLTVQQPDNIIFIDSLSYNLDISINQSYGKIPDGAGTWTLLYSPTPYHANIITSVKNTDSEINQLHQNSPNPFIRITSIEYYLAEHVKNAVIYIYDMSGSQVKNILLDPKGYGNIIINGSDLKAGMYVYTLVADGQVVDRKRMIKTE